MNYRGTIGFDTPTEPGQRAHLSLRGSMGQWGAPVPTIVFFFSPVFDGQWLGKMMIHWYPLDFWVIFRQNQVSHWIQIGWSRLDEEKGSQPVFYAYPLGDDMKGILNCNIRWFGNRCQQCLMFVFFNLSWVSWRRTSSTKNPLRLHKSSSSSR